MHRVHLRHTRHFNTHHTNSRRAWLHDERWAPEQMGPHGPGDLSAIVVQSTAVASESGQFPKTGTLWENRR